MTLRVSWTLGIVLCLSVLTGCVPTPTSAPEDVVNIGSGGTYVLCEGLWQQNNAVLSYIAPSQQVVRDVVSTVNAGERIGDTASDLLRIGNDLVVVVSTSRTLLVLDAATGVRKQTIAMPNAQPYRIATDGNGKMWVTNVGDDSITEIATDAMTVSVPRVVVGPAPEGICTLRNYLYVGLSGMGDLRKDEPGAGTIIVLRQSDLAAVDTIGSVPNVADLVADQQRDRVWASYRHYASQPDSLGGVVMINGTTRTIDQRWLFASPADLAIDPSTGAVFVLHEDGIDVITDPQKASQRIIDHTSGGGSDVWYSLSYDARTGHLLVGNARSYVTDGEVIEVALDGDIVRRWSVGLNPTAYVLLP
ncbi:MAG: hypothetical protein EHM43_11725 [Ignavibacteriae bacterium]|nr:MAG: hypothetical protein EHM43_11725 [Ignavibacteriota bacterium]